MLLFFFWMTLRLFALLDGKTFGSWFLKVSLDRGLEDRETLLADAIRPKSAEDTRSGCGSKHWPAAGGDTRRREGEETQKPERDWERVSHHHCHRVTHSGHSASPSVCVGPGRLAGDTLPLLPSIHQSISPRFILHPHTQARFFSLSRSQSPTLFVSAKGIFVMLSSSPLSITAIPASPVILVPARGSGMSSFCVLAQPTFYPWVKDTFL